MNTPIPDTFSEADRRTARAMLRDRWGSSRNLTGADHKWLVARFPRHETLVAVEMALRIAGLWDAYKAAHHPTWEAFRGVRRHRSDPMKTYIFRTAHGLHFFHIKAGTPADAVRHLVNQHGRQPYVLVAIVP